MPLDPTRYAELLRMRLQKHGAQSLILRGGRSLTFNNKVSNELIDFGYAHFFGMAFVMKQDVVSDPEAVGVFSARGVAFDAQGIAVLIEKSFAIRRGGLAQD
jgi:hypothetical protein